MYFLVFLLVLVQKSSLPQISMAPGVVKCEKDNKEKLRDVIDSASFDFLVSLTLPSLKKQRRKIWQD
jgi:hypothetical protein